MHSDFSCHQEHQLWKENCSLCSLWTPHLSFPMSGAPLREAQVCEMQIFTCSFKENFQAIKINAWHTCCCLLVSYDVHRRMLLAYQWQAVCDLWNVYFPKKASSTLPSGWLLWKTRSHLREIWLEFESEFSLLHEDIRPTNSAYLENWQQKDI